MKMANNLFNYTSQKLNAEGLRQINSFNSYNFAGIIGNELPFERTSFEVTLKATEEKPVFMLGGGLLLSFTEDLVFNLISDKMLGYIKVTLDENTGTVITDAYSGILVSAARCEYAELNKGYTIYSVVDTLEDEVDPHLVGYYEYEDGTYTASTDTVADPTKTYYTKYDSSNFAFSAPTDFGNATYNYNGGTIWVADNSFIIPLCLRLGTEVEYVVKVKDLRDLEGFLSLESYSKLKAYCEGTFVWTVGGQDEVTAPDGTVHKKGDIGGLNVTDNMITTQDEDPVEVSSLRIQDLIDSSPDDRLYVDEFGNIKTDPDYMTPVERGGTWTDTNWDSTKPRFSAKQNLGIYYGTLDPNNTYPVNPPVEGDIYLQIIDG